MIQASALKLNSAKKPKASEKEIEAVIIQYLMIKGWVVLKTDAGESARATKGANKRSSIYAGTPDLIALKDGRGIAIEVKASGGKLTDRQRQMHAYYRSASIPVAVVRSLEDLQQWLELKDLQQWLKKDVEAAK
jgi:hypothetical protein